jgi:hypothetical protein
VKYSQSILINNVVQDFNKVGGPVKTDKQIPGVKVILPVTVIKSLIVQHVIKSPADVCFGNTVLERRFTELDIYVHSSSIPLVILTVNGKQIKDSNSDFNHQEGGQRQ